MLNRSASFVFLLGTALSLLTAPGISGFGLVLQGQFYSGCAIANLYYVQTWKLDNGNLGTYYASCPAGMASTFTGAMATDCKYQETNFLGRVYWAMWCIELSQLKFPAYNGFLGLTPDLYNALAIRAPYISLQIEYVGEYKTKPLRLDTVPGSDVVDYTYEDLPSEDI